MTSRFVQREVGEVGRPGRGLGRSRPRCSFDLPKEVDYLPPKIDSQQYPPPHQDVPESAQNLPIISSGSFPLAVPPCPRRSATQLNGKEKSMKRTLNRVALVTML